SIRERAPGSIQKVEQLVLSTVSGAVVRHTDFKLPERLDAQGLAGLDGKRGAVVLWNTHGKHRLANQLLGDPPGGLWVAHSPAGSLVRLASSVRHSVSSSSATDAKSRG